MRGRGDNLHGKRLTLRPNTQRGDVVDVLTMLHRPDGGPRPINLDLALYIDELQDGGSSIMFGGGEWVTVSESVVEIMTLDADARATLQAQAQALVDLLLMQIPGVALAVCRVSRWQHARDVLDKLRLAHQ